MDLFAKLARIAQLNQEKRLLEKSIAIEKQQLIQSMLTSGTNMIEYKHYSIHLVKENTRDVLIPSLSDLKRTHPELIKTGIIKPHLRVKINSPVHSEVM